MDIHTAGSRREGVSDTKLAALADPWTSPLFTPAERGALRLADAMTAVLPVDVPDELIAELRAHFGDAGLVELAALVATENFRARFNRVFGIEAHGFAAREVEHAAPER
ncbi:MAG: carboxymuconolactone decarboxylase family protein [Chloroflexi bacterium]|nr:carboxymuconolactone decarboxylase family protein [Chloroflexota bacterium]